MISPDLPVDTLTYSKKFNAYVSVPITGTDNSDITV